MPVQLRAWHVKVRHKAAAYREDGPKVLAPPGRGKILPLGSLLQEEKVAEKL